MNPDLTITVDRRIVPLLVVLACGYFLGRNVSAVRSDSSEPPTRSLRNQCAEAFIRGLERGAGEPELTDDGDAMYQAFRDWADS